MPVVCSQIHRRFEEQEFYAIDREVMACAFKCHNRFGRFMDESLYRDELSTACLRQGMKVDREVEVKVSHKEFSKSYFIDLVVENGVIFELKAVQELVGRHEAQLLNYLMLAGLSHGKLVNFGESSVVSRFVSTRLRDEQRREIAWKNGQLSQVGIRVLDCLKEVVEDLGSFLELSLYREVVLKLVGEYKESRHEIAIVQDGRHVGSRAVNLLNSDSALHVSGVKDDLENYKAHLRRFLHCTQLKTIEWINTNGVEITCSSISRN